MDDADLRMKFKLFYEAHHAKFYCFSDGEQSTEFKEVDVRWIWDNRRRIADIHETVANNRLNGMQVEVRSLHDAVTTISYKCDQGDVVHVEVSCFGRCITEYRPDTLIGILARRLKKIIGLKREMMYFTFSNQDDAETASRMLQDIIKAAKE